MILSIKANPELYRHCCLSRVKYRDDGRRGLDNQVAGHHFREDLEMQYNQEISGSIAGQYGLKKARRAPQFSKHIYAAPRALDNMLKLDIFYV